jgi:DNA adenine methylase
MDDDESTQSIILPFLKWAGGKRWLTAQRPKIFPRTFARYVEPFLGSGAVFFYLRPASALLSDTNEDLIETFRAIKADGTRIERSLRRHHRRHSSDYYYAERARKRRVPHERASQFIYLNRTCWNGLYRVNLSGEFNVPIGTKTSVVLPTDNFDDWCKALGGAQLRHADFEDILDETGADDFVFLDPPYVTRHNLNGFLKYNHKIFCWEDQERLRDAVVRASGRGATLLLMNANHESIRRLYEGVGKHVELTRHSVLAADSLNRGPTSELAIAVNYDPLSADG